MNKENNKIFDNLASKEKKFRKKQLIIIVSLILFVTFLFIFMTFNTENKDKSITEKQNINNLSENQKDSNYDCVNDDKDSIYCLDRQNSMNLIQEISQDIEILKKRNAQIWNKDLFDRTIESFDIGSRSFKLNKFKKSIDDLNITSSMSKKLIYESDRIFNEGLDFGFKFLSEEKPELALEKFLEAQLIKNNDPKVLDGLFRAKVYPQIIKLLKDAKFFKESGDLDKAQLISNKALILDKDNFQLKVFSEELTLMILERDFLDAMKSGNRALFDKNSSLGISSFESALKLKPKSLLAKKGLENILLIDKQQKINNSLVKAKELELTENWLKAMEAYQKVFLEDENIAIAKEGYERVFIINNLRKNIENILSKPNRLSNLSIKNDAILIAQKADIASENFYLIHKKEILKFVKINLELKNMISKMSSPVAVKFLSDNKTSLIIERINSFEPFNEKFIRLKPGKYEVYARRRGFKEKRIIIEIDSNFNKIIEIICDERI